MSPSPRRVKDNAPYLSIRGLLVVLALISQLSALNFSARATELTDLGQGLSYLRVHTFNDTAKGMVAAIRERDYFVLDLRHAAAATDSAEVLGSALAARDAKPPVFILVGPATPTAIVDAFGAAAGKCITIGVKESFPAPKLIIDQPADADRLAYDALDAGEPLSKLISGKIEKDRYDEAALMKEFTAGAINAAPPPPPDPGTPPNDAANTSLPAKPGETPVTKTAEPGKTAAPAVTKVEPLIDRVLQRAVHLHRALLALKTRPS